MSVRCKIGILTVHCLLRPNGSLQGKEQSHQSPLNSGFLCSFSGVNSSRRSLICWRALCIISRCFDSPQMLVYFNGEQIHSCSLL